MASNPSSQEDRPRAALYVDGFNLYHPIRQLGPAYNHFKWASLWRLGELLTDAKGQDLVKVLFCTAVPNLKQGAEKRDRHILFNRAQRACGVTVIEGHYVPENIEIDGVSTGKQKWTEKQTDINVALELITDGLDDVYDIALLLSADTDQVATARVFNERLRKRGKTLVGISPPERSAPQGYSAYKIPTVALKSYDIERCIMPGQLDLDDRVIHRPKEYEPPEGWVHPDHRPKHKPPKPPKKGAWSRGVRG